MTNTEFVLGLLNFDEVVMFLFGKLCLQNEIFTGFIRSIFSLCRADPARLILTFGASVNAHDRVNGNTALHWACTSGNHAVTKQLIDAGADMSLLNASVSIH